MFYCGLDVAMKSSYVYITDAQGRKQASGPVTTEKAVFTERLKPYLRGGLALAIEAGNQTAWIHDHLVGLGVQVTVVNPAKLKLIAESRQKTDKIDARFCVSCCGSVACLIPYMSRRQRRGPCAVCWSPVGNLCGPG